MTMKTKQTLKKREAINERLGKTLSQHEILCKLRNDVFRVEYRIDMISIIDKYIETTLDYCTELSDELDELD